MENSRSRPLVEETADVQHSTLNAQRRTTQRSSRHRAIGIRHSALGIRSWSLICALVLPFAADALPQPSEAQPEFALVLREYLDHIVAGRYDEAVALTDLQGLANHLMEQRITVLKRQNPDMTPEEEASTRAALRDNELRRENLLRVLRESLEELDAQGAQWSVGGAVQPEGMPNSYVVQCRFTKGELHRVIHVGVRKIGPAWHIAPYVVEQAVLRRAAAKEVAPPEPVAAAGDRFWGYWRDGALDEAYGMANEAMRQRVSLLKFLESSQTVIQQLGTLTAWELLACREVAPGRLDVIYKLECSKQPVRAMIQFGQANGQWEISALVVPYLGP